MRRRRANHGPIGLDIGATGIRMLQFSEEDEQPVVLAAVHHHLPASLHDPEERKAAIVEAVGAALKRHPFRGREVVTALGCGEFQVKNIRLPRMPPEEMASAIEFEARDRFGMDAQSGQLRHVAAGEVRHGNDLKEEIIIFAASEETIKDRLRLLESMALRAVAIDIAPCSVARSFVRFLRRAEDADTVNVFLDVGLRGAFIVLTRGTDLAFLKVIEVGGEHLNEAVAGALSISKEEAADLRVRIIGEGCGRRASDQATVPREVLDRASDAVRPQVERISREVQLCLRYFAVTFRGQRPTSLTLVGGESHEPSLLRIVSEVIDVPCTIGNPLRGVGGCGPLGGRERRTLQPAWTVACGLALRGSRWISGDGHRSRAGGGLVSARG